MRTLILFLLLATSVHAQTEAQARAWLTGGTQGTNASGMTNVGAMVVKGPIIYGTNILAASGTGSTNYVVDCAIASVFYISPTTNFKLWITNCVGGFRGWIIMTQDGTGSRLMTYNNPNIKTNGNIAPSTAVNAVDRYDLHSGQWGTNCQVQVSKGFQ